MVKAQTLVWVPWPNLPDPGPVGANERGACIPAGLLSGSHGFARPFRAQLCGQAFPTQRKRWALTVGAYSAVTVPDHLQRCRLPPPGLSPSRCRLPPPLKGAPCQPIN